MTLVLPTGTLVVLKPAKKKKTKKKNNNNNKSEIVQLTMDIHIYAL